jgi:DNA-binding transcriptional regulator YdaS (Cro superfamily)
MRAMKTRRSTPQQWAAEAIKLLGGPSRAAQIITKLAHDTGTAKPVTRRSVQHWPRNRVPAEYCPLVELGTRELGQTVACEKLRPDIGWWIVRQSELSKAEAHRSG